MLFYQKIDRVSGYYYSGKDWQINVVDKEIGDFILKRDEPEEVKRYIKHLYKRINCLIERVKEVSQ